MIVSEDERKSISMSAQVTEDQAGHRIEQVAARLFPDYSRARLQSWMKTGELTVNGKRCKPRESALAGSWLVLDATLQSAENWAAEEMPLSIVYEDEELLVLDKQAELVVHPAAGHHQGTLVNGLLHYCPTLNLFPVQGLFIDLIKIRPG